MQLARHVRAFLKYSLGPKVALDLKYNFIWSMAIFPLSEAMDPDKILALIIMLEAYS